MVELLAAFFFMSSPQPRVLTTAIWACAPERWVLGPKFEDGYFKGSLETDCEVRDAVGDGLKGVETYARGLVAGAKYTHSGPIPETWDGLPSHFWDITVEIQEGSDTLTVRQDTHIALDEKSRFRLDGISKSVQGTGSAAVLRRLDNLIEVTPNSPVGSWRVKLGGTLWAKKPWYAPNGTFMNEVEKAAIASFQRGRDKTMPRIASAL
jgi:hypothetical protein